MNFDPTPEQQAFLESVRALVRERIAPHALRWDEEGKWPAEVLPDLARAGLFGIYAPREHGGRGLDTVSYALAIEELSSELPALAIALSVNNSLVANPIARFGTVEQKQRFLTPVASGKLLGAFALTEAEAGSDATRLSGRARLEDSGYVLNAEKVMVTNGGPAGLFLVVVATEPEKLGRGLTAFLVPADAPGVTRGARDQLMGLRSSDVRTVTFDNVRLGPEHRLGEEGRGLSVTIEALNAGRVGVGAQAVGIGRGALDRAVRHAGRRRQFGQTLGQIGPVQQMLAAAHTEIEAARMAVLHAAQCRDRGESFSADASRAKLSASQAAVLAASTAVQVFGGWGYLTATGVERFHRDAKVTELYEGTSEMQRIVLAGSLTRG
ncbi:MAG TPA: acyl-CoA dehydrogenase family protein [Candidatus Eisenbacteria bacterium]|jgi:alkylation response protein AidB-like acyl-CoA dehydrogenase|nr:acyl-CoA dehydrogenase family protein [Candidatus Eisenbacteria bacterium]